MLKLFLLLTLLISIITGHSQTNFVKKYGTIETIAGKGLISEKGKNGWKKSFEKKSAKKAELSRPHFAMADAQGNIFVADKDAHAIRRIDYKTGNITTVAGNNKAGYNGDKVAKKSQLNAPNGLFVLPTGVFYILDLGNNKIRKVDTKGRLTTIVDDSDGIAFGRGLWVSQQEDTIIYASGKVLKIWTSASPLRVYADGFDELGNICMDLNGNLIVTDRGSGRVFRLNNRLKKPEHIAGNGLKKSGKQKYNPLEKSLEGVRAAWPTPDGGLLLGCHESHDIYWLSKNDKILKLVDGGKNVHEGDHTSIKKGQKISETRSVTIDNNGTIIICEHDAGYVRVIRPKGKK